MYLSWNPGKTIKKLPRALWPAAMLLRNALWIVKKLAAGETFSQRDERIKLASGVEYAYCADVDGDVAEFGTMTGRTAEIIARAMKQFGAGKKNQKKLFLFDSFQGLPAVESPVDEASPHVRSGAWSPGSCSGASKEDLRGMAARFLPAESILIFDGWFKDTLLRLPEGTGFSMVHIDCDLYQSARDVLDQLFGRGMLREGAAIFFHDFDCNKASPDFGERKAWEETVKKFSVSFSDRGAYSWAGRKFLVHTYKQQED